MACLRCFGFGDTCSVGVNSLLLSTLAAKLPGGLSLQEIKNVTQRSLHISCLFQLFLDLSAWHIADRISRKQWKNPKNRSCLPAFITGHKAVNKTDELNLFFTARKDVQCSSFSSSERPLSWILPTNCSTSVTKNIKLFSIGKLSIESTRKSIRDVIIL